MRFQETKLVLFAADLAGFARSTAGLEALKVAAFLDDWYRQCAEAVRGRAGRVIKYMGDACLATFPEDRCAEAVDAALDLLEGIDAVRSKHAVRVEVGSNIHLAVVAAGEIGPEDDLRYDVLGSGVNHLFLMGGGAGVRISEPVYRQLPNDRRAPWLRNKPPATYTLARRP